MKFIKKPVVIEAIQWTGKNSGELDKFRGLLPIINDDVDLRFNDWFIKKDAGVYICPNDVFKELYTEVKDE